MKTCLLSAVLKPVWSGLLIWLLLPTLLCRAELQVGTASVDITPNKAVCPVGDNSACGFQPNRRRL